MRSWADLGSSGVSGLSSARISVPRLSAGGGIATLTTRQESEPALGRRGSHIFHLAVLESALLGLAGAALGVLVGVVAAVLISAIGISMPPPPNSEAGFTAAIRLVPPVIAASFGMGVVGAVVAALLPARKAARIPLVEALREAI